MATLTIKPTAAGNDIQIKSGSGGTTHATFGDTSTVNMSAGSIASAVTFPAGHILQTFSMKGTGSNTVTSSTSVWSNTSMTKAFSHASGNKVLLIGHIKLETVDYGYYLDFNGATSQTVFRQYIPHDLTFNRPMTIVYLDSPAGTSTTYTVRVKSNTNGTVNLVNTESNFTLMEIQG